MRKTRTRHVDTKGSDGASCFPFLSLHNRLINVDYRYSTPNYCSIIAKLLDSIFKRSITRLIVGPYHGELHAKPYTAEGIVFPAKAIECNTVKMLVKIRCSKT